MSALLALLVSAAHAAPISPAAALPGDALLGPASGDQSIPAMAAGDGVSLLVWEDTRAFEAGTLEAVAPLYGTDLWGIRVDAAGAPIDVVPFRVARSPWEEHDPRVAWSAGEWLVAWDAIAPTQFYFGQGVYAARVAADGTVLDPDGLLVQDEETPSEHLWDVAGSGDDFAVLWQGQDGAVFTLDGANVAADGTITPPVTLYEPKFNTYAPWNASLDWSVDRYLVAWEAWIGYNNDVQAALYDADLAPMSSIFSVSSNGTNDIHAAVAGSDDGFYVAWRDDTFAAIEGTPVDPNGAVAIPGGADLSGAISPLDPRPDATWTGTGWAVGWETYTQGYTTLVDVAGTPDAPLPTTEVQGYVLDPALAGTGTGSVYAFTGSSALGLDVEVTKVGEDGTTTGESWASLGAPAQVAPQVAGDAGGFLVVAESRTGDGHRIVAWRVDGAGVALDAEPLELAVGDASVGEPDVAWNGAEYLVVWQDGGAVWGARVLRDGSVLDPGGLPVGKGTSPAVAASGADFLVVREWLRTEHEQLIKGTRVATDGTLLDAKPFTIGETFAEEPDVAGSASGWYVGWTHRPTHDNPATDTRVSVVSAAGVPTPETTVRTQGATGDEIDVAMASDGVNGRVFWADRDDLRMRTVDPAGVPGGPAGGVVVGAADELQFQTAAGFTGKAFLVGWTDWRANPGLEPGVGDVYLNRVPVGPGAIKTSGLPVAADPTIPEGAPAIAGDGKGGALLVWTALDEDAPFAAFRLRTAVVGKP